MNDKLKKTMEQVSGIMSLSWKLVSIFLGVVALIVTLRLAPIQLRLTQLESTIQTVQANDKDNATKYADILKWMLKIEGQLGRIEGKLE